MRPDPSHLIFVDAHVHLHPCFDTAAFFNAARANFRRVAQRGYTGRPFTGVLCLVDGMRDHGFARLLDCAQQQDAALNGWQVHATEEDVSLCLSSGGVSELVIVAGRQIVAKENVEVLALGTRQCIREGEPAETVIHEIAHAGGLPVIPWGVGKWTGSRGTLVEKLLHNLTLPSFFLGDSAHRPAFWPRSSLFRLAEEKGLRNLPGSDPLPFPGEYRRPGNFGCVLHGALDTATPAQDLKEKLLDPRIPIYHFGRGTSLARFMRNQLAMQYRKLTTP